MIIDLRQGDCLDLLGSFTGVHACIMDPPYGVNFRQGRDTGGRFGGGQGAKTRHHHKPVLGDNRPFDPRPFLGYPVVVMFGAHNYSHLLPPSRGWIFWHKRPRMKPCDFGDGDLIWTNQDHVIQYVEHAWSGVIRQSEHGHRHLHPMQKPVALMQYLIERYTLPGQTVLDPFMGSGATGKACVRTGRNFIGVELDPHYFSVARDGILSEKVPLG